MYAVNQNILFIGIIVLVSAAILPAFHKSYADSGNSEENVIFVISGKTIPVIDGKFTSVTEWSDATETKFHSNGYDSYLLTKHDENYLYLMFDGIDFMINPYDESNSSSFQAIICFDTNYDKAAIRQTGDVCFVTTQLNEFGKTVRWEYRIFEYDINGDSYAVDSNYSASWNFGHNNDPYQGSFDHSTFEASIPKSYLNSTDVVGFSFNAFLGNVKNDDLVQLVDGVIWPPDAIRDNPSTWGSISIMGKKLSDNFSPLKQIEHGIDPKKITCDENKNLMFKISSGLPACVKSSSVQTLVERGWGIMIKPTTVSDDACNLLPDTGMCRAAFTKYYFDSETASCKQFIWGGCGGVVPFETLSECQLQCEKTTNNDSLLELFDDEPEVKAFYEKYDTDKSQRNDYVSYSAGNGDDFKVRMNLYFDENYELTHKRLYCYHDNGILQYEIAQEDILNYLQNYHCLTFEIGHDVPFEIVDTADVIRANNQFAMDFYSHISEESDENIFFSPWSISTAFAMAYEGAAGNTAKEMKYVFGFPNDMLNGREQYKSANIELNEDNSQYALDVANALWLQEGFVLNQGYVDIARDYYDSRVDRVDFTSDGVDVINEWVKQKTQEKIEELFPPGPRPQARLAITNAIYFNGTWANPFNEELTKEDLFWITPSTNVNTQMMQTDTVFLNYTEIDSLQILKLPYKGDKLSMLILLPDGKYHLDFFKEILTADNLSKWQSTLHKSKVKVIMPKFELETDYNLKPILKSLGMNDAFGPADFSIISNSGLYISEAVHKAFVNVNEKGTEAAAATGIMMNESGPQIFRADHPFLFIIQDDTTGNILFIGSMNNPE